MSKISFILIKSVFIKCYVSFISSVNIFYSSIWNSICFISFSISKIFSLQKFNLLILLNKLSIIIFNTLKSSSSILNELLDSLIIFNSLNKFFILSSNFGKSIWFSFISIIFFSIFNNFLIIFSFIFYFINFSVLFFNKTFSWSIWNDIIWLTSSFFLNFLLHKLHLFCCSLNKTLDFYTCIPASAKIKSLCNILFSLLKFSNFSFNELELFISKFII